VKPWVQTSVLPKLKYLGKNVRRELKDFYNENYKSLRKGIKNTLEDGRTTWVDELEESTYEKGYITEINLYFQCNPHPSFHDLLHRDRKINPNFIRKHKRPWIVNTVVSKKRTVRSITMSVFNLYYRDITIKKACYSQKNTY
jgi:hypothetical protein